MRKNYTSLAGSVVHSWVMRAPIVSKICNCILSEMNTISSLSHNSFLRSTEDNLKKFSWKAVHNELKQHLPTLMTILSSLIPKPVEHKPLQCFIACQMLKSRHPKLGLVQKAISVMLYGNSVAKQVNK